MPTKMRLILSFIMLALLAACSQVQPWERGYLAKQEMAWDSDPLERTLNDHIFFSKEASSGGNTAAGGGCGCN
ncbi:MAG: hypothetical protein CMQ69_08780 [Gammaproteobacteria bacterium]|nr:hypothetical protein [Gammaproteobacteria bacterium]